MVGAIINPPSGAQVFILSFTSATKSSGFPKGKVLWVLTVPQRAGYFFSNLFLNLFRVH